MSRERLRQHRGFVAFWTASTVSDFGSALTGIALQTLVLITLHGSNAELGLVSSARWIAYALVGLPAGLWLDRVRRRPVLITTDLVQGFVLGAVALLGLLGLLRIGTLVVLMILFGLAALFNDAAYQAVTPQLVPRRLLTRANTRLQQSTAVAQTSGPALAGLIIRVLGAAPAIAVDAVSFLLSAAVMTRLPRSAQPDSARQDGGAPVDRRSRGTSIAEIREGLRWIYGHRFLGPLSVNTHFWFICYSALNTIMISYAYRRLGLGVLTVGICLALGSAAALITTTISERVSERWGIGTPILISRFGYLPGVLVLLLAAVEHRPWQAVGCFAAGQVIIGLAFGLEGPAEITFRQAVTPDRLQGRTNATGRSVNRTMIVITAPLAGLLTDRAGFATTLIVIAVGFGVVGLAFALSPMRTAVLPTDDGTRPEV